MQRYHSVGPTWEHVGGPQAEGWKLSKLGALGDGSVTRDAEPPNSEDRLSH